MSYPDQISALRLDTCVFIMLLPTSLFYEHESQRCEYNANKVMRRLTSDPAVYCFFVRVYNYMRLYMIVDFDLHWVTRFPLLLLFHVKHRYCSEASLFLCSRTEGCCLLVSVPSSWRHTAAILGRDAEANKGRYALSYRKCLRIIHLVGVPSQNGGRRA